MIKKGKSPTENKKVAKAKEIKEKSSIEKIKVPNDEAPKKERGKTGMYHDIKDLAQKKLSKLEYENQLKNMDYEKVMTGHGYMTDGIIGGFAASIHKMEYTFFKQVLLGVLSGFIIGFGYTACTYAVMSLGGDNAAMMERMIMAIIFPFCIVLITFLGGGLYTSHVLATIPTMKGAVKIDHYIRGIFGVLLGNILGTGIFVSIAAMAGILEDSVFLGKAHDIGIHKLYNIGHVIDEHKYTEEILSDLFPNLSQEAKDRILQLKSAQDFDTPGFDITIKDVVLTMLFCLGSGILCNIMVSSTLPLTASTKNSSTTVIIICLPIFLFVMMGLQHGPANTFFLWIFVWELFLNAGQDGFHVNTQMVIIGSFIFANVIPTLIGNWIGGGIVLPGLLHLINIKYTSVYFAKTKYDMDHHTDEY
ncbi:hypothetical protein STIUS_v1c05110 [Spiroplasma sp. TIUS-1]|uniref:formate/nitrite transporter family protein n=1 Tax=Spiroplasma sp. TIUS-1 TaxID=216963 RepID=UPI0013992A8D|nr:formate/nitrite transporter family protein [Spiroplasma sp. TIUS-1]QHX36065.1 hypothetical protein STIUS_v1c05110 [Spiroplasma sp. TIUS-1]